MSQVRPVKAGSAAGRREGGLAAALQLMREALGILDKHKAPPEIGAHLDLAIQRLREVMARTVTKS